MWTYLTKLDQNLMILLALTGNRMALIQRANLWVNAADMMDNPSYWFRAELVLGVQHGRGYGTPYFLK